MTPTAIQGILSVESCAIGFSSHVRAARWAFVSFFGNDPG
jgi:hypothetical protein